MCQLTFRIVGVVAARLVKLVAWRRPFLLTDGGQEQVLVVSKLTWPMRNNLTIAAVLFVDRVDNEIPISLICSQSKSCVPLRVASRNNRRRLSRHVSFVNLLGHAFLGHCRVGGGIVPLEAGPVRVRELSLVDMVLDLDIIVAIFDHRRLVHEREVLVLVRHAVVWQLSSQ